MRRVFQTIFALWFGVPLAGAPTSCDRAPGGPPARAQPRGPAAEAGAAGVLLAPSAAAGAAPCGAMGCMQYDTPEQALERVLASGPLVLAVGEAHVQKGQQGVASATKRFSAMLPALRGRASDLLVELMVPARLADGGACVQVAQAVREKQKVVTQTQASTNQNEYVAMGDTARKLGVVPDLLRPTCEDLAAIDRAGPDMVAVSLETIARLTRAKVEQLVDRNARTPADANKLVLTYGGALHNDLVTTPERSKWVFGPDLLVYTKGRYVELDLYVPELIEDSDTWKKLEWYPHYDRDKLGGKVTLLRPREGSFVLIFAKS